MTQTPGYGSFTPMQPVYARDAVDTSLSAAFRWAWRAISANAGIMLAGFVIWGILTSGMNPGVNTVMGSGDVDVTVASGGLFSGIMSLLFGIVWAHVGLSVAAGKKLEFSDFFKFPNFWAMIGAQILVALGVTCGLLLLVLPGLVLLYLWYFVTLAGLDHSCDSIDAMKAAWRLAADNVPTLLPYAIVGSLLGIAGAVTVIGWVITTPLVVLISTYIYVGLTGRSVYAW